MATPTVTTVPTESGRNEVRLLRGLWVRNTAELIQSSPQVERFLKAAQEAYLTDVYLHVAPEWYTDKSADLTSFNTKLHEANLRIWASDGDPAYVDELPAADTFITGLTGLGTFNERVKPEARFHGFQADFVLEESDGFHNGLAISEQTQDQYAERTALMHKWLAMLTRVRNLVHSYGVEFGATMPFWLHDYESEPITTVWAGGRTGVMELAMPLVDQYVVMAGDIKPAAVVPRIIEQATYASEKALEGHTMPRVLGTVDVTAGGGNDGGTAKVSRTTVLENVKVSERKLRSHPAFCGMAIHDWAAWSELPP